MTRAIRDNVTLLFAPTRRRLPKFHIDEISMVDVCGMVLIEGCVPRSVLADIIKLCANATA